MRFARVAREIDEKSCRKCAHVAAQNVRDFFFYHRTQEEMFGTTSTLIHHAFRVERRHFCMRFARVARKAGENFGKTHAWGRFKNCPSVKTQRKSIPTMAKNQVIQNQVIPTTIVWPKISDTRKPNAIQYLLWPRINHFQKDFNRQIIQK